MNTTPGMDESYSESGLVSYIHLSEEVCGEDRWWLSKGSGVSSFSEHAMHLKFHSWVLTNITHLLRLRGKVVAKTCTDHMLIQPHGIAQYHLMDIKKYILFVIYIQLHNLHSQTGTDISSKMWVPGQEYFQNYFCLFYGNFKNPKCVWFTFVWLYKMTAFLISWHSLILIGQKGLITRHLSP